MTDTYPLAVWEPANYLVVPTTATTPAEIAGYAIQLRPRDVEQLVAAFQSRHFEMAASFVWAKAMAALRKQLATLGSEFIGEMLQRPDIDESSDVGSAITESEAISLAEDLGMINSTEAMRLRHAHEVVSHFASSDAIEDDDGAFAMTPEEAVGCLRACIQSVLGHPKLEVAQNFAKFRHTLEAVSLGPDDDAIRWLVAAPYFYRRTTLSVLLSLLKSIGGAALQHVVHNVDLVLPLLWPNLRKPERWQAGQTYAELHAEGRKDAFSGLKQALIKVAGFDYVPENLRSHTFSKAAHDVLKAHEAFNNFYNEPGPMRTLATLGTTIPSPAFPVCMTASLSVWLGNMYGHTWSAQESAEKILGGISKERWRYYFDSCLRADRAILFKLTLAKPVHRWIELLQKYSLAEIGLADRDVAELVRQSVAGNQSGVEKLGEKLYRQYRN